MSNWSQFFRSYLFKQSFYYGSYNLLTLLFHLIFVSLIAFFHFLLNHRLGEIEDWIFDRSWQIIIISKVLASFLVLKFISVRSDERKPLRTLFFKGWIFPKTEILVVVAFLFFSMIFLGRPVQGEQYSWMFFKFLVSYLCLFVFFMCDISVLSLLQKQYPLRKFGFRFRVLVFPLVMYLVSKGSFLYGKELDILIYFHFLMCLYLARWREKNWSFPAIYLLAFAGPMASLFGLDPLWGNSYSLLKMTDTPKLIEITILGLISWGYLRYRFKPERLARV